LSGFQDPRIASNYKVPNPNVTVLEWLNRKPAFAGKVAAFGAWDMFPFILNVGRSGLLVNAGYDPLTAPPVTPRIELLNRVKRETGMWEGEPFDGATFLTALEYYKLHKPRVLFLSLGDTDEWAHAGKYELYLKSAHRFDQCVKELWETAQSMPQTRGKTSLILAGDHGRGLAPVDWRSHGQKLPDTKSIWMAFLGPDTPALGERSKIEGVTQSQLAATLAALLGEDYNAAVAKAAKPITDVLR
ncbi:MAG: alkaline phosphatase family protein, partial [Acidobacteriota bacterium]|nr:alkaline phosphatase family protein [Acidobacteriota bacterium]